MGAEQPSTYLVTVHGIGPYGLSRGAAERLLQALGLSAGNELIPVDFNWCAIVDQEKESAQGEQLAASVQGAAHLRTVRDGLAPVGLAFELAFKALFWVLACVVVLTAGALAVYVRMGTFGFLEHALADLPRIIGLWASCLGYLALALVAVALVLRLVGARQLAASLLRRVLVTVVQPVLPLMHGLSETSTTSALRALGFGVLAYGVLAGVVQLIDRDTAAQWSGLTLLNLSLIALGFAALYLVALWVAKWIEAPFKLARDIFNYIGDEDQRKAVQVGLTDHLSRIPDDARVVLVGHSLGSVIALDSLCNADEWLRFSSVSFVSGGSPIHRFFQRFFPGLYFPAGTQQCAEYLASRMAFERWINVFRAGCWYGDPVGQALFASGASGVDVPVYQKERALMDAHLDYWDDPQVIAGARAAWSRVPLPASTTRWVPLVCERHGVFFSGTHALAHHALVLCLLLGIGASAANVLWIVQERRRDAREFVALAVSSGVHTTARVSHRSTTWGYGEGLDFPVQVYEFAWRDTRNAPQRAVFREAEGSTIDGGLYFVSKGLRERWQRGEKEDKPRTFSLEVLILPNRPASLTPADPALRPTPGAFPIFRALWTGVGPIVVFLFLLHALAFYLAKRVIEFVIPESRGRPAWAATG